MTDFIFFYRGGDDPNRSPEQNQKVLEKWWVWFENLKATGHLKDLGAPLDETGKVVTGKRNMVTDGPFVEAKDAVGGYSLILARDLAEATEFAKGCPILDDGGSVEVRQVRPVA
jgi:hypothetical protein